MSEWISVKDRIPEEGDMVLVSGHEYNDTNRSRFIITSKYSCGVFMNFNKEVDDYDGEVYADYWMPLPEPPKDIK